MLAGALRVAWRAHPRSRGENAAVEGVDWEREGSSPLTRGKRTGMTHHAPLLRLIPAHAGKTMALMFGVFGNWAHPRSRGENEHSQRRADCRVGSSPLTRGKRWPVG